MRSLHRLYPWSLATLRATANLRRQTHRVEAMAVVSPMDRVATTMAAPNAEDRDADDSADSVIATETARAAAINSSNPNSNTSDRIRTTVSSSAAADVATIAAIARRQMPHPAAR